jgi:hypothetical protein
LDFAIDRDYTMLYNPCYNLIFEIHGEMEMKQNIQKNHRLFSSFGLVHTIARYRGFYIVECGSYESYGFRVFSDSKFIFHVKDVAGGKKLVDKIIEAIALAEQYSNVAVIVAVPVIDGPVFYGIQFHNKETDMYIWQHTVIGGLMYPEFTKWAIIFRPEQK